MGPLNFDNKRQAYIRALDRTRETQRQAVTRCIETCEQEYEKRTALCEKKRKELFDFDADAQEWATNLAKAKGNRSQIAAGLAGSTPHHSDGQKALRGGAPTDCVDLGQNPGHFGADRRRAHTGPRHFCRTHK